MRLRIAVLVSALAAVAFAAIPSIAGAAPHHNRALTIHAAPRVTTAGTQVDIFGRLAGADHGNQIIRLYHRINPAQQFTLISKTRTDAQGKYLFVRADGVVMTNRSWFVRGPALSHSKVIHERVASLVSIAPDPANGGVVSGMTRQPLTFSGTVTPSHGGQFVYLQASRDNGINWYTLKRTRLGAGSSYSFTVAWATAGDRQIRVILPSDPRNTEGVSDLVSVNIQQRQVTGFSIQSSQQIVPEGTGATISGTVDQPGSSNPDVGASVSLYQASSASGPYQLVQTDPATSSTGGYMFNNVAPTTNTWYKAALTYTPNVHSAALFEGVQDIVMMSGPSSATVAQHVEFTGSVTPDKTGHVVYLQKLNANNVWQTVEIREVGAGSTYTFGWTFGAAGSKEFRARVVGGPANVGAVSQPVPVNVTTPPASSLPTG